LQKAAQTVAYQAEVELAPVPEPELKPKQIVSAPQHYFFLF
jgi:hypothetical protein